MVSILKVYIWSYYIHSAQFTLVSYFWYCTSSKSSTLCIQPYAEKDILTCSMLILFYSLHHMNACRYQEFNFFMTMEAKASPSWLYKFMLLKFRIGGLSRKSLSYIGKTITWNCQCSWYCDDTTHNNNTSVSLPFQM